MLSHVHHYDLDNFLQLDARLREHLRQKSPDGRITFTLHRAGSKMIFTIGIFSCVVGVLSLLTFQTKGLDLRGALLALASPVLVWWGLYGTIERIVIINEGLLIKYWKRTTMIPFNIIQGMTVQGIALSIHRMGQKSITLRSRDVNQMSILQSAIESAWKQAMSSK